MLYNIASDSYWAFYWQEFFLPWHALNYVINLVVTEVYIAKENYPFLLDLFSIHDQIILVLLLYFTFLQVREWRGRTKHWKNGK